MAKQQKVSNTGIKREKGYLYFLDKKGDVAAAPMARHAPKGARRKVVATAGVKREEGFLYFIDKQGDVARTPMARR